VGSLKLRAKNMENQQLREQLKRLQTEIGAIQPADASDREVLNELSADIGMMLARDSRDPEHEVSFVDRLKNATARFEASHAGATMLMGEVAAGLANLGL
jgi:hypothetical protein